MLSDHEIIEWKYNSREEEVDKEHLVGGWLLAQLVGSMEEDMKRREVVPADWWEIIVRGMVLVDDDEKEELEKEVELFERATREIIDGHTMKIELCTTFKRCCLEEIA
jgi:hypothetical protein